MKLNVVITIIISFLFSYNCVAKPILTEEIQYYYLGSYKALMGKPKGKGPFPVIIYSYDEFHDWAGPKLANKIGYNLKEVAKYFIKKGYICVIPVDRFRKVNAIIGIAKYLERKSYVSKNNIHLIGMSEGAFLNYIATFKYPHFKSMISIGPIGINDKGYLSLSHNLRINNNSNIPVLFLMIRDVGWRINEQSKVYRLFKTKFNSVKLITYYKEKRWFWNINHKYIKDINNFLESQYNLPDGKTKNTY